MIIIITLIKFLLGSRIEGMILKNIMFIIFIVSVAIAALSVMVSVSFFLKEKSVLKINSKIN